EAVLVNDSAIGTDQTVRFVLVVDQSHHLQYRPVELGPMVDGLRVVRSGLHAGDAVVVDGLMRVHPGMQVNPQLVAMGSHDQAHAAMVAQHAADSPSPTDDTHLTADADGNSHHTSTRMNR